MRLKTYAIAFFLLLKTICHAQTFTQSELKGTWYGRRFDVDCFYDFMADSTYREWTSNRASDSSRIWRTKDLDSNYIHMIDENHFYILVTFYATEKIIFSRVPPKPKKISDLKQYQKIQN
jgi:hypothetical protein